MANTPKKTKDIEQPSLKRSGGRPSLEASEQLRGHILDVATTMLLSDGYGATSIEDIARQARISKRTFYARFKGKPELMNAVVLRFIDNLRPPANVLLIDGDGLQNILTNLASLILHAAMTPRALQMQRLIIAESERFPDLALAIAKAGGRQEAEKLISDLLMSHSKDASLKLKEANFAAQHFLQMVVSVPQLRAFSLGTPMTRSELEAWPARTVELFLKGFNSRLGH